MKLAYVLKFIPLSINNCSSKTWKIFHLFDELLPTPNKSIIHLSDPNFSFHTGEVNERLLCWISMSIHRI